MRSAPLFTHFNLFASCHYFFGSKSFRYLDKKALVEIFVCIRLIQKFYGVDHFKVKHYISFFF